MEKHRNFSKSNLVKGVFYLLLLIFSLINSADIIDGKTFGSKLITYGDAEGYYLYLPAVFIYGDFKNIPVRSPSQLPTIEKTGNIYDKYTFGVAILELPFFLIADLLASNSGPASDGYSKPYQVSIAIAGFAYTLLGLLLIFQSMKVRFGRMNMYPTLIAILFGTNLLHYMLIEPGMSHAYSFFLIALMIYYTPKVYKKKSWGRYAIFSIIMSLIVFVRPINFIVCLYYLLYQVSSFSDLKSRGQFILKNLGKHILLVVPFLVLACVQIWVWKEMSGENVFWSYNNEPGFVFWKSPKMWNVLFHVHNGLLIYAPVLALSIVGLIWGALRKEVNFAATLLILTSATYIFGSWWAWWFGGAYGHRCYIDYLPFFAFGFAGLFQLLNRPGKRILEALSYGLLVLFIFYSVKLTAKYLPPWDGSEWTWDTWLEAVSKIF